MWLWLNQNAGAVQALAAVLMFFVTTVLCPGLETIRNAAARHSKFLVPYIARKHVR
jgi:hypothetical protein